LLFKFFGKRQDAIGNLLVSDLLGHLPVLGGPLLEFLWALLHDAHSTS